MDDASDPASAVFDIFFYLFHYFKKASNTFFKKTEGVSGWLSEMPNLNYMTQI